MIGWTNVGSATSVLSLGFAVIHVTAPVGSTISFSKGGVIVDVLSPDNSIVNINDNTTADWYYSISSNNYGEWMITATDGTDTASDTVLITTNKEYDVGPLCYPLILYDSGNQCVNVTGGWEFKPYSSSSGVVFEETDIYINPADQYSTCVGTVSMSGNKIAPYSTLKAELQVLSTGGGTYVGIMPNYNLGSSGIDDKWTAVKNYTTTGTFTASVNISALTTGYVLLTSWKQKVKFSKVWLEP